ncbi:cytochrome c-type biogenesis protein [Brevundimonas sp.]|uniref:cytochrome c-type biogenesis protein n=1 Tax=Brevundimonas sp. TaxID=1871086 RepID=UPI002D35F631|nr:cytochrome c-type biogenesis protein [Brevundimonas sp.]HYC97380.1 cytochrome c-type biogenesis protein [Brevundimonas sp.]
MKRTLPIALASMGAALGMIAAEPPPAPDRPLPDAAREARAQALFDGIRCVVCQHEAIADSPAVIAADMRGLVREQIAAGRSDAEIKRDLVRRYGDFVLFRPPVRAGTWLLWFGPFALMAAVAAAPLLLARRRRVEPMALSPEEEAQLADIVAQANLRRDPDAKPSDH